MIIDNIKTRVLGVDITVDKTTCAIIDIRGNLIATCDFATSEYPDIGNYVAVLCEHLMNLMDRNGGYESVRSVGIASPSANIRTGCIENSPNMPWKGVIPLAAMLRDRLGLAVALGNNAHVMAMGEHVFGAAHGMRDFVVVSLGNGVGSCIYSNGLPHLGNDGFAGEVGHTCFVPNGRLCGCGKRGCLEAYVGANGIVQTARELMEQSSDSSMMHNVEKLSPRIIAEFCELGDELAIETYRRMGESLGIALANYASVLNPEAFIFAGGVAQAAKWFLEYAQNTFEQHVFHNIVGKVKFIPSNLENRTRNMLGASVLAWGVKEYSLFK